MQMDMSCIVTPLAQLGHGEAALEVFELLRLERERTGRPGDLPTGMRWLEEAVAIAQGQVDPEAAGLAQRRARAVPVIDRAARTIEVANQVLAAATPGSR
jgi:hypothetical protein